MNDAVTNRDLPDKCPQCGATLPAGALAGLCPACLLQQGAAADTATRSESKPFVPPTVEEVARLFPQLQILGFLGKGGMGAVYKARQPALDRLVALKILPAQAGPDPGFTDRFTREARALARLSHPNIVAVHEFGQVSQSSAGGTPALPYFIMEYVDGVNLRQLQKAGRLSPREALQIVPQICDALQYAHDEGVVHRDIKPENVLVDRKGRVKIADFGLAKILGCDPEALRLTGEDQVMGTPHYMAPEQVEHPQDVDHRADIFSLGVVFYEMLTGELPLGKFQPPSRKVQVDVRLDEVVLHALEKEPERRYQHVSDVKTAVETIAATTAVAPPAPIMPQLNRGVDYRSKASLFGLPLLHVTSGFDPATGRPRVAKGIIAIGGTAVGIVAIGGVAVGVVAFGGLAIGAFACGGGALGLFALGGGALALIVALGGGVIAPIALGGGAIGYYVYGSAAAGVHVLDGLTRDPVAERFFLPWAPSLFGHLPWINVLMVVIIVGFGVGVPGWMQSRLEAADTTHIRTHRRAWRISVLIITTVVVLNGVIAIVTLRPALSKPGGARQQTAAGAKSAQHETPTSAEFHWRVFEAEAVLVDKLIPAAQRKGGVQPGAKAYVTSRGVTRTQYAAMRTNSFAATTYGNAYTVSRLAEINPATLDALLEGIGDKPGVLASGTRNVSSIWWPSGTPCSWLLGRHDGVVSNGNGTAHLAMRRNNGQDEIHIEGEVTYAICLDPPVEVASKFLYEGNAPQDKALAFLVPFFEIDNSAHYLVVVYQVGTRSPDKTVGKTAGGALGSQLQLGTNIQQPATPEQLTEPPTLRFLAWQDEWKTNQPAAARHPDGSLVTDPTELDWLHQVQPSGVSVTGTLAESKPRFLHLWISHPAFDPNSYNELSLRDGSGNPVQLGGGASFSVGYQDANDRNGNFGWLTPTLSPGDGTNLPTSVTVRLCYTVGPLEHVQELVVTPHHGVSMSLEGGSALNGVGQNVDGRAFVAVAVDVESTRGRRFDVNAVAQNGREFPSKGGHRGGTVGAGVGAASFEFDLPLAEVAKFRIGTRPIRTNEWKDVVLPPLSSMVTTKEQARPVRSPPFIAELPQGKIELVAISCHPSENQPWWQADGKVWTNAAFENPSRHSSDTKGRRFEFIFQRRGFPKDTTLDYSFEPGALETTAGDPTLRQGRALPDHNLVVVLLPESAEEVTIRLGVAAGEWKKVAARAAQTGGGGSFTLEHKTCTALFLDPVESGEETRIGVSYNKVPGWTMRVTAMDTSGHLHESFAYGQSVEDTASAEGRFKGLPLSRVKEFRFEARPYAYVEFRNVSLEPGRRTQVEVLDAEDE